MKWHSTVYGDKPLPINDEQTIPCLVDCGVYSQPRYFVLYWNVPNDYWDSNDDEAYDVDEDYFGKLKRVKRWAYIEDETYEHSHEGDETCSTN